MLSYFPFQLKVLESKVTKSNEKVFELQINLIKMEEKLKATEKEKKMAVDKLENVQEDYKQTKLIKPAYGSLRTNLAMSYGKGQAAYKGSLQDISRMRQVCNCITRILCYSVQLPDKCLLIIHVLFGSLI